MNDRKLPSHVMPTMPIRIARPSASLPEIERFWIDGVRLAALWHTTEIEPGEHHLSMVGPSDGAWHLELVADPEAARAAIPGPQDLLVIYVGTPIDEEWVARIERHGGVRVDSVNPYWDRHGVTIVDPDGYRLVLSSRAE